MGKVPFCINGVIREAFGLMKKNFFMYCGVWLVVLLVAFVMGTVSAQAGEGGTALYWVLMLVVWLLSLVVAIGVLQINLQVIKGKEISLLELFSHVELLWKFLVASIFYTLMVLIGLVFLIVPGIYLAVKYQFFGYLIVDKKLGPLEALQRSGEITRGCWWDLFFAAVNFKVINLIGAICLLLGMFVSVPIVWLAQAKIYRELE